MSPELPDPGDGQQERLPDDDALDDVATAIEEAARSWDEAGLRMPPVPRELADDLDQFDDMDFGTGEVDLADRDDWLRRARDPTAVAAVAFGHVGHGVNSYNLCYQLVVAPLALFVRQRFGGVYDRDPEGSRDRFNDAVERLEELVVVIEASREQSRIKDGQRLILAIDEAGPSGWELAPAGPWHDSDHPINDALRAVAGL